MNIDIDHHDTALIYIAFLRRMVQDASGPDLIECTLDEDEREETREYLTSGNLEQYGYYIYEEPRIKLTKRICEKKYIRFVHTEKPQDSTIKISDIQQYTGDYSETLQSDIQDWKKSGWVRTHYFYERIMEKTKCIT